MTDVDVLSEVLVGRFGSHGCLGTLDYHLITKFSV